MLGKKLPSLESKINQKGRFNAVIGFNARLSLGEGGSLFAGPLFNGFAFLLGLCRRPPNLHTS